jgi:PAS domain S-box-containing protein
MGLEDLRGLIDSAPDVIAVLDRDGRYLYINNAIERALGHAPSVLVGKTNDDLMTPGDAARWREVIAAALATGETQHIDCTMDTPRGTRTFASLITRLGEDRVAVFTRDVTDRQNEDRFTETMHRIASSFASELDHDRLVQRIIDELTHAVGAETGSFYPGDVAVDLDHSGSTLEVPIVGRTGDLFGRLLFRHRESGRFNEEHQRLTASVATHAAIALENARLYRSEREHKEQLERAIERARVADRRKDEFLAMLGHELRNPLAPITTALELLDMKEIEGGRKERDVIVRQVAHLSRLIDDLLDMSRITRGKIQLDIKTVEIASVLARAIESASPLLEKKSQRLAVQMPPESALVDADPVRLAQVFHNLLTNAAKYSDRRSQIDLSAVALDSDVSVTIRDHGIGISPDLLPRLFEMFVQGERSLDRSQGGLGVGLTIARSLCELHGGTITAHSAGLGTGSTFTVTLPRSVRARVSTDRLGMRPLERPRPAIMSRVLVVDDNVDAAMMLREMLTELGHELQIAHDGPSALELAATFKPDIAVLDIGLPVMNGYELARKLREQLGDAKLRLIAVTGYGQETDRARAQDVGFDHHLIKPIELDALLALLTK